MPPTPTPAPHTVIGTLTLTPGIAGSGDAALAGELPTNETNRATVSAIKPAMPRRR